MPQMSGLEVHRDLRISPSTHIIIFTGKDDPLVRSTVKRRSFGVLYQTF
jgi:DNA-binding NarL/FixJ family response regulator